MRGRTRRSAEQVADAPCNEQGYQVWRDDELPAHRAYAESSRNG